MTGSRPIGYLVAKVSDPVPINIQPGTWKRILSLWPDNHHLMDGFNVWSMVGEISDAFEIFNRHSSDPEVMLLRVSWGESDVVDCLFALNAEFVREWIDGLNYLRDSFQDCPGRWEPLGYEVWEFPSGESALVNAGQVDNPQPLIDMFGNQLNEYGLFSNLNTASQFANVLAQTVQSEDGMLLTVGYERYLGA